MTVLTNLIFALLRVILANGMFLDPTVPQEISLDILCHKFPHNSRCQAKNYSPDKSNLNTCQHQFKRDRFCRKCPLNSQGLFTIHYQENDLRRSLSFRIPADVETETNNTVTVTVFEQTSE
jgi:hypothetical protein